MYDWKYDEIQHLENQIRQMQDERREQQERQREEINQHVHEYLSTANNWEDAFNKGIRRAQDEIMEERQMQELDPTFEPYFVNWAEQLRQARDIYNEEMTKARNRIADRVATETHEYALAQALRNNDYTYLVNW